MAIVKLTPSNLTSLKCPVGKQRVEFCDTDTPGYIYLSLKLERVHCIGARKSIVKLLI